MKVILALVTSLLLLSGCQSNSAQDQVSDFDSWVQAEGKTRILCTIGMISDIATRIGGDRVVCLTLIRGDLDPHSYELVKGDDEKFAYADLVFSNGLGLEHGPSLRRQLESGKNTVAVGDDIRRRFPKKILYVDGVPDPHIWMDMSMWIETLEPIVEALSKQDPEHAEEFRKRAERVREEMLQVHAEVLSSLQSIPSEKRYLVTSHDAFQYFCRTYLAENGERQNGMWTARFEAPEGLAPESQLSVMDIRRLLEHLQEYRISVMFTESNVSRDSLRKIMAAGEEMGLNLRITHSHLYADAMGPSGTDE